MLFISFVYSDCRSVVCYENTFVESFVHGRVLQFYDVCVSKADYYKEIGVGFREIGLGVSYAYWDFLMYICLGIWGIPLYLVQYLFGIDPVQNMVCLIYGKSIFIVALILIYKLICSICNKLDMNKSNSQWTGFLFLSSICVYTSVCLNGQADVLGIIFILLGISFYIDDKMLPFVLSFSVAVAFKSVAFFIFLPCLLLKEKRICKIALYAIITMVSPLLNDAILSGYNPLGILFKQNFTKTVFEDLMYYKMPIMNGEISVFILIWGGFCAICYLRKKTLYKKIDVILVSAVAVFAFLVIYYNSVPYRYIYLSPFFVILVVYFQQESHLLILLETVGLVGLTLAHYVDFWWCFEIFNTNDTILSLIMGRGVSEIKNPITLQNFTAFLKLDSFVGFFYAIFIISFIVFIIICYLCRNEYSSSLIINFRQENFMNQKTDLKIWVKSRMCINLVIAYIPFLLFIVSSIFRK